MRTAWPLEWTQTWVLLSDLCRDEQARLWWDHP